MFMKAFFIAIMAAVGLVPPVFDVIMESPVYAEVQRNGDVYREPTLRLAVGTVVAGQMVEILEDYSAVVYKVGLPCGTEGWIGVKSLRIPADVATDTSIVTDLQLEEFVNERGYESATPHLLLVDIARQKTYVFEGEKGAWTLLRTFDCSTGTNTSPTTRGTFSLKDRGAWFYSHRLESGAKYWIRFNGHYLFHTIPMDKNKNILAGEDVVGIRSSNGCVRLLVEDMRWIYENVADGAGVVIL